MSDFRTIVVPYDFSDHARAALDTATDLAKRLDADLHLVHVIHVPSYAYAGVGEFGVMPAGLDPARLRDEAATSLSRIARGVRGLSRKVEAHVSHGAGIADVLRETAEKLDADLIVMGTHGRTGLAHVFLGSVAERTLRRARCPVLTVQAPDPESPSSS